MSAFSCYFDASGTQHDKLVLAVAGFMSTAEIWLQFEKAWMERLKKSNLSYFHRNEISPEHYPGLLRDLAIIARDHSLRKFGMVSRVEALHSSVSKLEYDHWSLDAYSYAGRACAAHVRIWAARHKPRTLPKLVFATGDKGRDQLEKRLRLDGFRGVTFQPVMDQIDRKTKLVIPAEVPLQAADLLAYELFNVSLQLEAGKKIVADSLSTVWFILDKVPGEVQITDNASLRAFKERVNNFSRDDDSGVKLATWKPQ